MRRGDGVAGVTVSPGDIVVADGNGVVVVPMGEAAAVLGKAQRLLAIECVVQDKIRAGATIGELIDVDQVLRSTFAYQDKASGSD
jgi:regulator of RNase E activity RraA